MQEWITKALDEISWSVVHLGMNQRERAAAIISKHAPEYHIGLDVASGTDRTVTSEFYAAEPVRELVEAAREALSAEHSHNHDHFSRLRHALEPFKGVS